LDRIKIKMQGTDSGLIDCEGFAVHTVSNALDDDLGPSSRWFTDPQDAAHRLLFLCADHHAGGGGGPRIDLSEGLKDMDAFQGANKSGT